jgi:hypothetical protein
MAILTEKERKKREKLLQRIHNDNIKQFIESNYGLAEDGSFEGAYYALKRWYNYTQDIANEPFRKIAITDIDNFIRRMKRPGTIDTSLVYLKLYFEYNGETILANHAVAKIGALEDQELDLDITSDEIHLLYINAKPKLQLIMRLMLLNRLNVDSLEKIVFDTKTASQFFLETKNPLKPDEPNRKKLELDNYALTQDIAQAIAKKNKKADKKYQKLLGTKSSIHEYYSNNFKKAQKKVNADQQVELPKIKLKHLKIFSQRSLREIEKMLDEAPKKQI